MMHNQTSLECFNVPLHTPRIKPFAGPPNLIGFKFGAEHFFELSLFRLEFPVALSTKNDNPTMPANPHAETFKFWATKDCSRSYQHNCCDVKLNNPLVNKIKTAA